MYWITVNVLWHQEKNIGNTNVYNNTNNTITGTDSISQEETKTGKR
jgi:hypothetical protein